jgi:hypothetical protein
MSPDSANEQLRDSIRIQNEILENQKQSFEQLITLQKQQIANQERDAAFRQKVLRVMIVLMVVYLIVMLAPIWMWREGN